MTTLLDPNNRTLKRGVKWVLAAHTVAIFSFTTIACGIECVRRSSAYIGNREYPGVHNVFDPGPFGYMVSEGSSAIATVDCLVVPLNQWFIDGLLLYRCYILYSMNYWIIILPGVMYLATVAMSIAYIYENGTLLIWNPKITDIFLSYNITAVSLNVLLTVMIIIRILQHRRNLRSAVGTSGGGSRLYTAIITMLVESCAPYTVTYLLYIVPVALGSYINFVFAWIFGAFQVIAPYLIILRVANRKALGSDMLSPGSGANSSIRFVGQGVSTGDGDPPGGGPVRSMGMKSGPPGGRGAGAGNAIEVTPL